MGNDNHDSRDPKELERLDLEAVTALIKVDPFLAAASQQGAAEITGGRFPKAPRSIVRQGWPHMDQKAEVEKPARPRRGIPW